jgi:hypothetical protein
MGVPVPRFARRRMSSARIFPRSGVAFKLAKSQRLTVIDPEGSQVADLLAFATADVHEVISNGRTFDYEETIALTTGNRLWSNRSRVLLTIVEDTVQRSHLPSLLSRQTGPPRLLRQPGRSACTLRHRARRDPGGVQLLHERAGRRSGWSQRAAAQVGRGRPIGLGSRRRPDHRTHRLLGLRQQRRQLQADRLRDWE